jgi:Flp pilus assembly protein TadG
MVEVRSDRAESERCERGDTLVEFALISIVLMTIIVGILDLGRAVYAYSVVANCAREGARHGIIAPEDHAGISAAVQGTAVGLDPSQLTVIVTNEESTIRVSVSYNFEVITPLITDLLGAGSLTLASSATMYTGY